MSSPFYSTFSLTNLFLTVYRSYFEMAPASLVARLTANLVAGYNTYGFDEKGQFPELSRINKDDLPGKEFWLGGEIARNMPADERKRLTDEGVRFYDNPQRLLADLAEAFVTIEGS